MREISRTELSKSKESRGGANALFPSRRRQREKLPYLDEIGFVLDSADHAKLAQTFIYPPEGDTPP